MGRPKIPAAVRRNLLLQCSHRCSVCGEPSPLEFAHIVPWCETQDHSFENLVCLCANCHSRADKEKWPEDLLRDFKEKPWQDRQREAPPICQPSAKFKLKIVGIELDAVNDQLRKHLIDSVSAALGKQPGEVRIISIEEGSVIVGFESNRFSNHEWESAVELLQQHLPDLINTDESDHVSVSFERMESSPTNAKIHPSAVIDPSAILGDVVVGPFCVIGGDVRIADNTTLHDRVTVEANVTIGSGNVFHSRCVIGGSASPTPVSGKVEVGDGNVFQTGTIVYGGEDSATQIGNHNFLMSNSIVGNECQIFNNVIIGQAVCLGEKVQVADNATVGSQALVSGNLQIGRLSFVASGSRLSRDVPPFLLVEGNNEKAINIIGLRRAGISQEVIRLLNEVFRLICRSRVEFEEAREFLLNKYDSLPNEATELLASFRNRSLKYRQKNNLESEKPESN